ncbi:MAG: quinone-interacting membrane-bound oxidoreductase complex subunit QmoC [Thermoanaerobaculaceae bacterium]|jgi:quinone-modifying oxidoreductase subunit QmoC|nr:quinone-interacting membrane-bound oxidoreductase complex subunit QmoC [Thermoanaerobaculaceae bacterium]
MAATSVLLPSADLRQELTRRGAGDVGKCYQCATCSSVCELAPTQSPFPRRQMLLAQWGLLDRLAADPAVWLCHQCNDCTVRCPRDAKPGDVLQAVRSLVIEKLAFPAFLGRFVAKARATWPLLLGLPLLFWVALLGLTGHLGVPADLQAGWAYEQLVPHVFIYGVFFPVAGWVLLASVVSGRRFWKLLGSGGQRTGSFVGALAPALGEIAVHRRFGRCGAAKPRQLGHLTLLWGFVGAAVTSGLLIVGMYIQHLAMPLPLSHPYKILGNVSGALLVVGGAMLVGNRLGDRKASGTSSAFDSFFLGVVVLVIATGMTVELARLADAASFALTIYVVHLGAVMTLFLTFPYSKFAHMLYRTLAMVHARLSGVDSPR